MDPRRFDSFVRGLGRPISRRVIVAALTAALTPADDGADAKRGSSRRGPCGNGGPNANKCRKNRDCCTGFCFKRKRGKGRCICRRQGQSCAGTRNCCQTGEQALVCIGGACKPSPCNPACDDCQRCVRGQCQADPNRDGACCDGDAGVCANGTCATCGAGQTCCTGGCVPLGTDANCAACGDVCVAPETCFQERCCTPDCAGKCGGADDGCGGTCNDDCGAGRICVGQTCVAGQGTCTAGEDACGPTAATCNGRFDCYCRTTSEGGTRCGGLAVSGGTPGTCGECSSTAECETAHPDILGVFCMKGGSGCCNHTDPKGLCVRPCPS